MFERNFYEKDTVDKKFPSSIEEVTDLEKEHIFDIFSGTLSNHINFWNESENSYNYYEGKQWSEGDIEELTKSGQAPIVLNLIKQKINSIAESEVFSSSKIKVLPREYEDKELAQAVNSLLDYEESKNGFDEIIANSKIDFFVTGLGGFLVEYDEEQSCREVNYINYRELIFDYSCLNNDFSDSKYVGQIKYLSKNDLMKNFPKLSQDDIQKLTNNYLFNNTESYLYNNYRNRSNQIFEFYKDNELINNYIVVELYIYMRVGEGDIVHEDGEMNTKTVIYKYLIVGDYIYSKEVYPYKDFPIVLMSAYRDLDGHPYGLTRDFISPQDLINKTTSKLQSLIAGYQVLAEEGALDDASNIKEELSSTIGIINNISQGALSNGSVQINGNNDKISSCSALIGTVMQSFSMISGTNNEFDGSGSNARSGTAIAQRIRQAQAQYKKYYTTIFRALRDYIKISIELIADNYTEKKTIRVTNKEILSEKDFISFNNDVEEINADGLNVKKLNDLSKAVHLDLVIPQLNTQNFQEDTRSSMVELIKVIPALQENPNFVKQLLKTFNFEGIEDLIKSF